MSAHCKAISRFSAGSELITIFRRSTRSRISQSYMLNKAESQRQECCMCVVKQAPKQCGAFSMPAIKASLEHWHCWIKIPEYIVDMYFIFYLTGLRGWRRFITFRGVEGLF